MFSLLLMYMDYFKMLKGTEKNYKRQEHLTSFTSITSNIASYHVGKITWDVSSKKSLAQEGFSI